MLGSSSRPAGSVVELASGIDALYCSGRAEVSVAVFNTLEANRQAAEALDVPVEVTLAGEVFEVEPRAFGRYRYRLKHSAGLFGVTPSVKLPTFYFQPNAEYLHGAGELRTLAFFDRLGRYLARGPVDWG